MRIDRLINRWIDGLDRWMDRSFPHLVFNLQYMMGVWGGGVHRGYSK